MQSKRPVRSPRRTPGQSGFWRQKHRTAQRSDWCGALWSSAGARIRCLAGTEYRLHASIVALSNQVEALVWVDGQLCHHI